MKEMLKKYRKPYMIRPVIYKIFTRFLVSLAAALLWDRFVNSSGYLSVKVDAMVFFGATYLLLAWLAYLRLDGVKLPSFLNQRPVREKKPKRGFGDMIDYIEEKPIAYEELEEDERDACLLAANLVCGAAFIIISII